MEEKSRIPIKIVAVGQGGVGKSCVLTTYTQDKFPTQEMIAVFDSKTKIVKQQNNQFQLSLWDTGGRKSYASLRPLTYDKCDIFLIFFSVADKKSYEFAKDQWFKQVNEFSPSALKIFVGNKIDLRKKPAQSSYVTRQMAKADIQNGLKKRYYQCSAVTREGINQLFQRCILDYIRQKKPILYKEINERKSAKQGGCCQIM